MPVTLDLQTPALLTPMAPQGVISINAASLPVAVATDTSTGAVVVSIKETNETFTLTKFAATATGRSFTGDIPLPGSLGSYTLAFVAHDTLLDTQRISPSIQLTVIVAANASGSVVYPPAGIQVLQLYDRVRIQWTNVSTPGFQGVRVRTSTDSSGVSVAYTQFGDLVPNNNTSTSSVVIDSATTTQLSADLSQRTTVTQETLQTVGYSSMDILRTDIGADQFFATVATVVQDPNTFQLYESAAAGPFTCSFVNLQQVSPADFPPSTQPEQIVGSLIKVIAQEYGDLDQSPRSELRDLQADPFALELSNATIRSWFTRVSRSLSALCQIDDMDGDGVSDEPSTNPYKQAIALAFRVTNSQVQSLIDTQFDVQAELAGTVREGPTSAIIPVTFFVQTRPSTRITVQLAATVATIPDSSTPSVSYQTLGSAVLDPANLDAYWLPELNGWGVTIDCQCTVSGSTGSVGAGTIRSVVNGTSAPMQCVNLTTATLPGQDNESNARLATRVQVKRVTGVDSGTAPGYYTSAMGCYGVVDTAVVQAGDVEMLRDWDPVRKRHIYGCVDIYVQGANFSQATQQTPYYLQDSGTVGVPSTYTPMAFSGVSGSRIRLTVPGGLAYDPASLAEVYITRAGGTYLGTDTAVWDPQTRAFYLNPAELSFTYNPDGTKAFGSANSAWISGLGGTTISGLIRYWAPLEVDPTKQPVTAVTSVVGNASTGSLPASVIELDKTASDPLLEGNSSRAQDMVRVLNSTVTEQRQVTWATNGALVLDLGEGVYASTIQVDAQGNASPGNILSVRSLDASTLYAMGTDYKLVALGPYNHFGITRAANSTIPLDTPIQIAFLRYRLIEQATLRADSVVLSGSTPVSLNFPGFIGATWVPLSHGLTGLTADVNLMAAQVPYLKRYIKVSTTDPTSGTVTVYQEGSDFALSVDPVLGPQISKFVSGTSSPSLIPDNTAVDLAYYTAEVFTTAFTYPQFLTQLETVIQKSRHGGADTLAKAMMPNFVDMNFTVTVANTPTSTPTIMDPKVRTSVSLAVSLSSKRLSQSDVVRLVTALPGVTRMSLPLTRMAKSDGSYIIGEIIPTGTSWVSPSTLNLPVALFPVQAKAWVTKAPVLSCSTIPSGGQLNSYVGLLYEGQAYRRCKSLIEFSQATDAAFYIIGLNDSVNETTPVAAQHYGKVLLNTPDTTASPTALPYRVTYQVYGEVSSQDISLSSLEYLLPGQISIAYEVEGQS